MREHKYSAWDKTQEGYINGFNMIGFSTGQGAPKRKLQRYNVEWNMEDVILEQSTGLKDSEGREIYEGDIMKSSSQMKERKQTGVVKWIDVDACLALDTGAHEIFTIGKAVKLYNAKVIGTIHENPELLEGEK